MLTAGGFALTYIQLLFAAPTRFAFAGLALSSGWRFSTLAETDQLKCRGEALDLVRLACQLARE